jgi:hypothetical protein
MLGPGVAEAARAVEPRWRMAASVCDNLGFLTGLLGYFALQSAPADGANLWRFVAFEGGVVVLVAAWAVIVAAILRRVAAGAVKV